MWTNQFLRWIRNIVIIIAVLGLLAQGKHAAKQAQIIPTDTMKIAKTVITGRLTEAVKHDIESTTDNNSVATTEASNTFEQKEIDTTSETVAMLESEEKDATIVSANTADVQATTDETTAQPTTQPTTQPTDDSVPVTIVSAPAQNLPDPAANQSMLAAASNIAMQQGQIVDNELALEKKLEKIFTTLDKKLATKVSISYYEEHTPRLRKSFDIVLSDAFNSTQSLNNYTSIEKQIAKQLIGAELNEQVRVIVNMRLVEAEQQIQTLILDNKLSLEEKQDRIQQLTIAIAMDESAQRIYYAKITKIYYRPPSQR